jgi:hypothetical protein
MKQKKKKGPGRGWHGDPEGHARAGRKGGQSQGRRNNPGNFANNIEKAREAGRIGGSK